MDLNSVIDAMIMYKKRARLQTIKKWGWGFYKQLLTTEQKQVFPLNANNTSCSNIDFLQQLNLFPMHYHDNLMMPLTKETEKTSSVVMLGCAFHNVLQLQGEANVKSFIFVQAKNKNPNSWMITLNIEKFKGFNTSASWLDIRDCFLQTTKKMQTLCKRLQYIGLHKAVENKELRFEDIKTSSCFARACLLKTWNCPLPLLLMSNGKVQGRLSWTDIKKLENPNPFLHTILDAFKRK
jgi:hypothetical protein